MIARNDENQKQKKKQTVRENAGHPEENLRSFVLIRINDTSESAEGVTRNGHLAPGSQGPKQARKQRGESKTKEEKLHRLPGEDVLDVRNCPGGIHERATWEDRETLLGGVQHLLDVGQHPRDIGGDQWMLNNKDMVSRNRGERRIHDVPRCRAPWPCAGATAAKA